MKDLIDPPDSASIDIDHHCGLLLHLDFSSLKILVQTVDHHQEIDLVYKHLFDQI